MRIESIPFFILRITTTGSSTLIVYIMAVATGKQWSEFFAKNIHLPPAFDREHAAHDISTPFCLGLNFIEGVTAGVSILQEGKSLFNFAACLCMSV